MFSLHVYVYSSSQTEKEVAERLEAKVRKKASSPRRSCAPFACLISCRQCATL